MLGITAACDRYNISSRSTLYSRLNALQKKGINTETTTQAGSTVLSSELIESLDDLDKHLKNKGTLDNFEPAVKPKVFVLSSDNTSSVSSGNTGGLSSDNTASTRQGALVSQDSIDRLAIAIAEIIKPLLPPVDPLWKYEKLDQAVERGYLLSSSDIKLLLGLKPRGSWFTRGAYVFTQKGKVGRESAWRVKRINE